MRGWPADKVFAYRLALALGKWNVTALLTEMSATQFREWQEFDRLDPIGGPRLDALAAMIATTSDGSARNVIAALTGKHPGRVDAKTYFPEWGKTPPQKTPRQLFSLLKSGLLLAEGSGDATPTS